MSDLDPLAQLMQEMRALQEHFVQRLPERRLELEEGWAAAQAGGSLEAVRLCAHSLRGTAGTLGFFALGEVAAPLERAVQADLPLEQIEPLYHALLEALGQPQEAEPLF